MKVSVDMMPYVSITEDGVDVEIYLNHENHPTVKFSKTWDEIIRREIGFVTLVDGTIVIDKDKAVDGQEKLYRLAKTLGEVGHKLYTETESRKVLVKETIDGKLIQKNLLKI